MYIPSHSREEADAVALKRNLIHKKGLIFLISDLSPHYWWRDNSRCKNTLPQYSKDNSMDF